MALTAAPAPARPTHADGYRLFQEVAQLLYRAGWRYLRVDTMTHSTETWTVRHHYTHGEWEWYFEPDKYWNPHATNGKMVRVRLDRPPLPVAESIVCELFGIKHDQFKQRLRDQAQQLKAIGN